MLKNKKKGFTLTELIICIAIIAVMAVVAIPVISGLIDKGNDTSEDVNASLYSSAMKRFAAEKPGEAYSYPRLTSVGSDSEYDCLSAKAGKGVFPGYNIFAGETGADVLNGIRKEAAIAIKAFSDTAVSDNYTIPPPADEECEYVYYYLTGEVKKVKRSSLKIVTAGEYINGEINVSDYWVYLSRNGGSGAALGGVNNGTGHLFIRVIQYGTNEPLSGATVTVSSGAKSFTAVTSAEQNGFVGFSGVPVGTANITVSANGAVTFPNSAFYAKTGEVFISERGYEGCQLNSPYVVELKLGSLGSLGFYKETLKWSNNAWTAEKQKITDNITVTSDFIASRQNPGGSPRSVKYISNLSATNGVQELLADNKNLTYGNYRLNVSSYGFRTYSEDVKSSVFGIDNASNKFAGKTSPYEYPITMLKPNGRSELKVILEQESDSQPLSGTPNGLSGTWAITDNRRVRARVRLVNTETGDAYYSAFLSADSEGKCEYTITGLPDGTYNFEIESPYKHYDMSNFPRTVMIDGREVEVSGKLLREDVGKGSVNGKVTFDYRGEYDPIPGAYLSFARLGDRNFSADAQTDDDGNFTAEELDCGFYQVEIMLPDAYGGETYYSKLFVSKDESCTIRLGIQTVNIRGFVMPYLSGYKAQNRVGTLRGISIVFQRVNTNGVKKYSEVAAAVNSDNINAEYSVNIVPGYYIVEIKSKCYSTVITALHNIRGSAETDYYIFTDTENQENHSTLEMTSDKKGHWKTCDNCGETFEHSEHSVSDWTYKSENECYRYCTVCDYVTDEPSAHKIASYVSKAATCTTDGEKVYYCERDCGHKYTEKINKSGHTGNGIWVYDNNGSSSSNGTHHQNCKNCDTVLNSGSGCSRGGFTSNGTTNHYDKCSVCSGKRYFNHSWKETSRSGYSCTGGKIYYKCNNCSQTKTGSYSASAAHNMRARCDVKHACSWRTKCSSAGVYTWNGYYHILCSMCGTADKYNWCAMHCGSPPVKKCPF